MKKLTIFALALLAIVGTAAAYDPLELNLPNGTVDMSITYPGADSYWSVTFSNIPSGYFVENGKYPGWCADANRTISPGAHETILFSAYDDSLPAQAQSDNWDLITYMVNQYRDGAYPCASKYEIQTLVWQYLGDNAEWETPNQNCMGIIQADVNANGEGYMPTKNSNDIVPVICYTNEGLSQLIFVEIPYFPAPEVIAALAAIALAGPAFGYLAIKKRK